MRNANYIWESLAHLFFPHFCPGCGSDAISISQTICLQCLMDLPETGFFENKENPVKQLFEGRIVVEKAASLYYCARVSKLHNMIHELKYRNNKDIGIFLGKLLGQKMLQSNWSIDIDALIPVPLHTKRERSRGYNQTQLIAEGIAEITQIPIWNNVLVRTAYTETQTHKGRLQRITDMEGKFKIVDTISIENKHILLIDDLLTTGATLEFCALEILKVAGTKISIATVGRSIH